IGMAALALTAATFLACSDKDGLTPAPQAHTYTLTTTLSPKGGVGTRSTLTDNGDGSISAAWEVGDQIWVLYTNIGNSSEETMATVTAVDPSTKAAKISLTLTNPKNGGTISFGYPAGYYNAPKNLCIDQTGTLDDINANFAVISGAETMFVSDSEVTLPDVTMMPAMCIWKFSFTDGTDDITSAVTKLVIDFPANNTTYTVTPTSLDNIYVAMYGDIINGQPVSVIAQTDLGVYRKTAASVTLASGTTYTSTGLELTSAAITNAVAGDIGQLVGADGNIYPNANIARAFGASGVAMIGYVGDESDCTHGVAVALDDENGKAKMELSAATAACAAKDAVPECTWRLPSCKDWQYLFIGCGSSWTYTDSPSSSIDCSGLQSALDAAGGIIMSDRYICTEGDRVDFTDASASFGLTDNPWYVRAVLAF
ncbi:MAG: hypothetical protein K5843_08695, partial [Bacteroidales bacterium]|nr:hypothetical protein [Bacteroidales bacterium]